MKKTDYKIGSLVSVKSGRYIIPKRYNDERFDSSWAIDIPSNAAGLITETFPESINKKSYIALVKGYKIIVHSGSICENF